MRESPDLLQPITLQKKGVDVLVLEASSRVGGRMMTDVADGYMIDGGTQFLSSAYPILSRLIKELDLASAYTKPGTWAGLLSLQHSARHPQTLTVDSWPAFQNFSPRIYIFRESFFDQTPRTLPIYPGLLHQ